MGAIPDPIPAAEVSRTLAERGVAPDEPVAVLLRSDLIRLAREIRQEAKARGMTPDVLEDILADL
jgi:hypothetical protein